MMLKIKDRDQQNLVRNSIIYMIHYTESDIDEIKRTGTLSRLPGIKQDLDMFEHWLKEYEDLLEVINQQIWYPKSVRLPKISKGRR